MQKREASRFNITHEKKTKKKDIRRNRMSDASLVRLESH